MLVMAGLLLSLVLIWLLPGEGPPNAGGAVSEKVVDGFVYDVGGQPVGGAEVRVEIWGGSWPEQDYFRTSQSTVTDYLGYYEVIIDSNYWDPHNTIRVIATDGPLQGEEMIEADGDSGQTVDVTLAPAIPNLSSPMAIVSAAFLVALILRRRAARTGQDP